MALADGPCQTTPDNRTRCPRAGRPPEKIRLETTPPAHPDARTVPEDGPRVVIAGSRSPVAAGQIRAMARHSPAFVIDPADIRPEREANRPLV